MLAKLRTVRQDAREIGVALDLRVQSDELVGTGVILRAVEANERGRRLDVDALRERHEVDPRRAVGIGGAEDVSQVSLHVRLNDLVPEPRVCVATEERPEGAAEAYVRFAFGVMEVASAEQNIPGLHVRM